MTVTIDGREVSPELAEALKATAGELIAAAIVELADEFWKKALEKLDTNDPIEIDLFSVPFVPSTSPAQAELWAIYLIRPGDEKETPRTTALLCRGKVIIRFTRATGAVARPIAIMNWTGMKDGQLTQTELFLVYNTDGKWKQYHPGERKESLGGDQE